MQQFASGGIEILRSRDFYAHQHLVYCHCCIVSDVVRVAMSVCFVTLANEQTFADNRSSLGIRGQASNQPGK